MKKMGLLCLALVVALAVMGGGVAYFSDSATINVMLTTGHWEQGGSPGFWHNCIHDPALDSEHYSGSQTNIWLNYIDSGGGLVTASEWLVPDIAPDPDGDGVGDGTIDIADMLAIFDAGEGPIKEDQFLRHYLATRLNVEAGRLSPDTFHLFSGLDPDDYLDLEGQGDLELIIDAIEGKYGTPPPTDDEFEIMKDICDALNNLDI